MHNESLCRKARYAGAWYAGEPEDLRSEIGKYLSYSSADVDSYNVRMAVLPHAGLYYSGRSIARFFNNLPENTDNVCIISPSHYTYLTPDKITTADFDTLETPLAQIPYRSICEGIPKTMRECNVRAVKDEHAVEMVLPFISYLSEKRQREISVSIMLVSSVKTLEQVNEIAQMTLDNLGRERIAEGKTVIIASSDFTHYGTRFGFTPYGSEDIRSIMSSVEEYDRSYARGFAEGSIEELLRRFDEEHPTICGFAPALLVSAISRKMKLTGVVVDYYTSNELNKNPLSDFVSYCSVFWE